MKAMTGKEALECAEKLKAFCRNKKGCKKCPFKVKYNDWENGCIIANPYLWSEESAVDTIMKENSETEEMLDRYYNSPGQMG